MMCSHETHSAPQFKIASDGLSLWNEKGYRLSKATHGVEYGAWYYEVEILPHTGNTRIGWSQISGDLQGPCGFDRFSYSYREKPGSIFHESVGKQYGDGAETGDVIGLLIYIPELSLDEKRDLLSRRWSLGEKYIEYSYFPTNFDESKDDPSLVTLPKVEKSQIVYFKNGECMGVAFENINLGKYHPAISSYKGGRVAVNFGPMFKYPPPSDWLDTPIKPFSEATEMSPEEVPEPQPLVEVKSLEANSKPFKRSGTSSSCDFTGSEDGSTTRRSFHKRRLVQKSQSRSPSISRELY
ncbi:transcription factor, contains a PHD finger motif [Basidiobolus ranarum]|uniref:Transcription factor, contains a PHD finger motif n=1 Tax=Basidiobolus ranarum TaxID=34480 RepID=A0ABR2W0G7_9FUNG